MKANMGRVALTAASLAMLLALGACGDRVEDTAASQPLPTSVELDRAGMSTASDAGDNSATRTMGAAPAIAPEEDPDARISTDVKSALASDPAIGTSTKIDVHSEDGTVTLRGQAPDPDARDRATEVAKGVRDVKSVDNQLTLG
jgi:hyperosmotically inducible protein